MRTRFEYLSALPRYLENDEAQAWYNQNIRPTLKPWETPGLCHGVLVIDAVRCIVIQIVTWDGAERADLRLWMRDAIGDWKATTRGFFLELFYLEILSRVTERCWRNWEVSRNI